MPIRQNWKLVIACLLAGALGVTAANYGASLYFDLRFLHVARLQTEAAAAAAKH
jgi:hypothetical protein